MCNISQAIAQFHCIGQCEGFNNKVKRRFFRQPHLLGWGHPPMYIPPLYRNNVMLSWLPADILFLAFFLLCIYHCPMLLVVIHSLPQVISMFSLKLLSIFHYSFNLEPPQKVICYLKKLALYHQSAYLSSIVIKTWSHKKTNQRIEHACKIGPTNLEGFKLNIQSI